MSWAIPTAKAWHALRRCFFAWASLRQHISKEAHMSSRVTGTVEWFDNSKGFGYIQAKDLGKVFVHYQAIADGGIRHLCSGDQVEFSVRQNPRGPEAVQVTRL